jgi:Poxvirus A32 protein
MSYNFKNHSNYLFIAKRNSGKTHLIKYLIHSFLDKKNFQWGVVFSATNFNTKQLDIVDKKFQFDSVKESVLEQIIKIQEENKSKSKKKIGCFIIFDDVLGSVNFKSDILTRLFSTCRHNNISIFLATQYLKSVPPLIRQNSDYVFLFQIKNLNTLRDFYDEWGSNFETFDEFKIYFRNTVVGYSCLLVDQKDNTKKEMEIYSCFTAPNTYPDFKLNWKKPNYNRKLPGKV